MRPPSQRTSLRLAIAITCAAILLSLSMRGRTLLHTEGPLHPWYHLALFITLGLLAYCSSAKLSVRVALLAAAVLFGLSIEYIEYIETIRYHNPIEWYDVRTDTAGVAIGAILGWVLSLKRNLSS
jgi:glycopeptide antibiotics resistance protein